MSSGNFILLQFPRGILQDASIPTIQASAFQRLPMEVIISILDNSDLFTRINLSLTCRYFAQAASTSKLLIVNGLNPSPQERRLISDLDFLPIKLLPAHLEFVSYSQKLQMFADRVGCKHCNWRRRPDTVYQNATKWWRYNIWTETIARHHFAPWVRSWGGIPTYGMIKLMLRGIWFMHEDHEKKQSRYGFLTLKVPTEKLRLLNAR